ncbi:MAG: hypothetical protein WCG66_11005 [bacterium]
MNPLRAALLVIFFLGPLCLRGQQQERKLIDRIQNPQMDQDSVFQSKSFGQAPDSRVKGSPSSRKTYALPSSEIAKEYPNLRSFFGIKNPWFGQRIYDAKPASLSTSRDIGLSKNYTIRSVAVQNFPDSSKTLSPSKPEPSTKPFLAQGGAQGAMSQISEKVKKEMTIDDVRELLNKPR